MSPVAGPPSAGDWDATDEVTATAVVSAAATEAPATSTVRAAGILVSGLSVSTMGIDEPSSIGPTEATRRARAQRASGHAGGAGLPAQAGGPRRAPAAVTVCQAGWSAVLRSR